MLATWCTTTPTFRPSLGRRICHSVSESVVANAASAAAPASRRTARASDLALIFSRRRELSLGDLFVTLIFHFFPLKGWTVTRKKVAGIEVPPFVLLFCAFASSSKLAVEFSTLPVCSAAS